MSDLPERLAEIFGDPPCAASLSTRVLDTRLRVAEPAATADVAHFSLELPQEALGATGTAESYYLFLAASKALSGHVWAMYGDPGAEIESSMSLFSSVRKPGRLALVTEVLRKGRAIGFFRVTIRENDTMIAECRSTRVFHA
jgi:acyl-coenzyme A thioesterase PaaI-like protein